nr:sporamin B [Ipomoea batatas]GMD54609.1 sporamin B [Ipomoea batatas]GMD57774.1 sporamin B [Ipomoea batatas]GME13763.1 sporamin B [Ipomoea batatas]GME15140.1 sporamin B [Ipomoea batatas]
MKTLALLFALSLLILPNSTHSIRNNPIRLPTASDDDTPVLDIDGDELRPGVDYYIFSLNLAREGRGVRLVGDDTKCPTDVILSNDSSADPIIITPADTVESTPLNFKFNISTTCENNNLFWEILYDPESGQQIVKTGECYNVSTFYDSSIDATRLALSRETYLAVWFRKRTPVVLDADGEQLRAGEVYNILSIDEPEGEVALVGLDNTTECASDVVIQDKLGDPIIFRPRGQNAFVFESTRLNIKFSPLQPDPYCTVNVYWDQQYDPISNQTFVKAVDLYSELFKIERAPSLPGTHFYKITYCLDTTCSNVDTYKDTPVDATRLVLTNDTFQPFVFKKVTTP